MLDANCDSRHQQQLILLWLSLTTARTYAESNGIENWESHMKTVFSIHVACSSGGRTIIAAT